MIASMLAIAIINRKKYPVMAYCIFFFFLNHIVESTIIPLELIFEHRNYIPSFFLFLPIAIICAHVSIKWLRRSAVVAASVVALFFAYNTYTQNKVWATDIDLWYDVCKKSPDPRSVFNYAGSLYQQRQWKEAVKYWEYTYRFNELFGTNYSHNPNIIPYGRVAYMGYRNYKNMSKLARHGWDKLKVADAWTIREIPQKELKTP
jgi:hypothetical protein